jgi:sterol desaturase/sphingolipid hydroxylase (fatty acid hydroxylase superfamily)
MTTKNAQTNPAGSLMIVATTASMVIFILSAYALQDIYRWYPRVVAQQWFIYDQLLTAFSFLGLIFGALATSLLWSKRSFRATVTLATICTLCGLGASIVTLIEPLAVLWESIVFYFLPLFITPLTGTLLAYLQEEDI